MNTTPLGSITVMEIEYDWRIFLIEAAKRREFEGQNIKSKNVLQYTSRKFS